MTEYRRAVFGVDANGFDCADNDSLTNPERRVSRLIDGSAFGMDSDVSTSPNRPAKKRYPEFAW